MKAKLALCGIFLCLVQLGLAVNPELTFNLNDAKPLRQIDETVCGCPSETDAAKCASQNKDEPAAEHKHYDLVKIMGAHLDKALKSIKSLMNKEERQESSPILSTIQVSKAKEWSRCREEKVIECDDGMRLKIVKASLSNLNPSVCPSYLNSAIDSMPRTSRCNNTEETLTAISARCNGKPSCSLSTALDELKSICECDNFKYLNVSYICVVKSNRNKRQSDRYLYGRQRAFSRLMLIGLYPSYFNFDPNDAPPAVPETNPNPTIQNLEDVNSFDVIGRLEPAGVLDSFSPFSSSGAYGSSYDTYSSGDYPYPYSSGPIYG